MQSASGWHPPLLPSRHGLMASETQALVNMNYWFCNISNSINSFLEIKTMSKVFGIIYHRGRLTNAYYPISSVARRTHAYSLSRDGSLTQRAGRAPSVIH